MPTLQTNPKRELASYALIVVATLAAFARAVPYSLQTSWDDGRFIVNNPDVHQVSWRALASFFTQPRFEAYHPLHLLSYWIDVPWVGANGPVLHAVSLVLWCGAACLFYAFLRALGLARASSVLGTLLCVLHPVQVEAVSWATGRKDVLALLFASASLLLHVRSRAPLDRAAWGSHLCFLLAALSKTTTLPLPVFVFLLDVVARDVRPLPALRKQLPKLLLAGALSVLVVRTWQLHDMVRTTAGGVLAAPIRLCVTWTHQLATALWPSTLSPMYSTQALSEATLGSLLGPVAVLLACLLARLAKQQLVLAALVGFAVLMLPVSNLVPMYFPLQDRYMSLPSCALALAAAALLDRGKSTLPLAVGALLVLALFTRTVQYEGEWSSELRLWGHAVSTEPRAEYAWLKLGEVRRDAGQLEGAIDADRHMVALAPTRKLAWAALFEVVALRDERTFGIAPTHARDLAQRYYDALDDTTALRDLSGLLLANRYLRALELPMSRSLALQAIPDALLERAARSHVKDGRPAVARFYLRQMHEPSTSAELAAVREQSYFSVLPETP